MSAAIATSLLMVGHAIALFPIPLIVGYAAAGMMSYRGKHRFWVWDFKRRKIEQWRWLVETPPTDTA